MMKTERILIETGSESYFGMQGVFLRKAEADILFKPSMGLEQPLSLVV